MAEGYMDYEGNIHVTNNQFIDEVFKLVYVYSIECEITFSLLNKLFSGPNYIDFRLPFIVQNSTGESQSMILGNEDMIHLTL